MNNMKIPSMLWVSILLILPPMLIPWIEQFFPTDSYWWSALVVVLLNALVLVVKANWGATIPAKPENVQSDLFVSEEAANTNKSLLGKLLIWGA